MRLVDRHRYILHLRRPPRRLPSRLRRPRGVHHLRRLPPRQAHRVLLLLHQLLQQRRRVRAPAPRKPARQKDPHLVRARRPARSETASARASTNPFASTTSSCSSSRRARSTARGCSAKSRRALEREDREKRDLLFPIRLDDSVFDSERRLGARRVPTPHRRLPSTGKTTTTTRSLSIAS